MAKGTALYRDPSAMEPLFPKDATGELEHLATELIRCTARLSAAMHPETRVAVAELVRPMNSYYSNLIEGHDTHPFDIDKALRNEYAKEKKKRDLQKEAHAHIVLHREMSQRMHSGTGQENPASSVFLKGIHRDFYQHLPASFKKVLSKEGEERIVVPGEFRKGEVEVGQHVAPSYEALPGFMQRFEEFYDPAHSANRSLVKRVIAIAAAHHRLAWIHPFLDGNGRVVRLFSDASFMREGLDASGLWSISRGLARTRDTYREMLAAADMGRMGDHDGRGNLSNKKLVAFCTYFLEQAIDQVTFMHNAFQLDDVLRRIHLFVDHMAGEKRMHTSARYVLEEVFLRGKVTRKEAERLTSTTHKTLKKTTDQLIELGLLATDKKEGLTLTYHARYPIRFSPWIFPGLFPGSKETEMMLMR